MPVGSLPPLRDQRFAVTISLSHHVTVMLGGYEACNPGFRLTVEALEDLYTSTNLTAADLACVRDDVVCHDVDGLERHGCTDEGLRNCKCQGNLL